LAWVDNYFRATFVSRAGHFWQAAIFSLGLKHPPQPIKSIPLTQQYPQLWQMHVGLIASICFICSCFGPPAIIFYPLHFYRPWFHRRIFLLYSKSLKKTPPQGRSSPSKSFQYFLVSIVITHFHNNTPGQKACQPYK
jgi:hypothetical protein